MKTSRNVIGVFVYIESDGLSLKKKRHVLGSQTGYAVYSKLDATGNVQVVVKKFTSFSVNLLTDSDYTSLAYNN